MRVTKLVLVSAGTFGSPGILERSGIGSKDVLERVEVKQRVDLPGVGKNYQGFPPATTIFNICFLTFARSCADHNILLARYFAADEAQSLNALFRNEEGAIDGGSAFSSRGVLERALRLTMIP